MKKALVIGASGAMGVYLVPELVSFGYCVDAVSLVPFHSNSTLVNDICADLTDISIVENLCDNHYDVVIDFMHYTHADEKFLKTINLFMENCGHYFFLSSYRVYANEQVPITEDAPLLLYACKDEKFLARNDYSLYKVREENVIRESGHNNWTIVRPAITFSKRRAQLTVLEMEQYLPLVRQGKKIMLPEEALDHPATMSWAGDVAKMFVRLANNPVAFGQIYTISTSEHHTWREIADIYHDLIGLEYVAVDTETFIHILYDEELHELVRYQLLYDRCFDRIINNSKILRDTGLTEVAFTPLKGALALELSRLPREIPINDFERNFCAKMDAYLTR
ncbi:MAG: NAD-dependent epimerase/dehydratase family protein [Ruminococcaceae bacterium]|nr:NAD-dependent epimerase/dehydratase family protein [Oscillospiraceae bacterium]